MAASTKVAKEITTALVTERVAFLKSEWGTRNTRMDDMEKLYRLDVWEGKAEANEWRVTSPRPFTVVEAARALMFTKRPVIEVPSSVVKAVAQDLADRLEKHLYGVWDECGMMNVVDDVEFHATCHGLGVLRFVYNPLTPVGELPLVAQSLDPKTFYNTPDPTRPGMDLEVAIYFKRDRRDIQADWGPLPGAPDDAATLETWLDTEVDYTDYWCTRLVEEEEETETASQEPLGALGKALAKVTTEPEPEPEKGEREGDTNRTKTLRRRVINCVMADDRFVKEPAVMPGYERLPFFHWCGVRTPLDDEDACLSVLYPIAGGQRANDSQGLISAENQMLSWRMRLLEQRASAAGITNDPSLASLDATPGAINIADRTDYRIDWAIPPGEPPEMETDMRRVEMLAQDATIPDAMMGRYQAAASGVALSMVTNPVLMRIASKQRDREDQLQRLNSHILSLTEEYAPAVGWAVYGRDREERELEERLDPLLIQGYRRNRVHLSARLPNDAPGEALMLRSLIDSKILSRRTAVERIQEILDLAGQSPSDENKQVLVESILFGDDPTRRAMAQRALREYDAETAMAAEEAATQVPGGPGGAAQPPGSPGPLAQGPMGGMPPGVLPPQALPEAVGGQDLMAMLAMQGQAPGQMPPGPPPGPQGG